MCIFGFVGIGNWVVGIVERGCEGVDFGGRAAAVAVGFGCLDFGRMGWDEIGFGKVALYCSAGVFVGSDSFGCRSFWLFATIIFS